MKKIKQTLALGLLLTASVSFGGHGKEGGDPKLINKADLYLFIDNEVKIRVTQTVNYILSSSTDFSDQTFKHQVEEFKKLGLLDDVVNSTYKFQKECLDRDGVKKGATADLDVLNGEVCWSTDFLLQSEVGESDITALAFHEHIHHFGEVDADHKLASKFKKAYLDIVSNSTQVNQGNVVSPVLGSDGVYWLPFKNSGASTKPVYYAFEATSLNASYVCKKMGFNDVVNFSSKDYSLGAPNGANSLDPATFRGIAPIKDIGGVVDSVGQYADGDVLIGRRFVRRGILKGKVLSDLSCK